MGQQPYETPSDGQLLAAVSIATTGVALALGAFVGPRMFRHHPAQLALFLSLVVVAAAILAGVSIPRIRDLVHSSRSRRR